MPESKIGRLLGLADSQVRSEALGKVEVIQGLAGNARWLYELATGAVPGDGQPATPPNPQGLVGCDLSGPPWGSALWHPVAWWGGISAAAGNVTCRGHLVGDISSDRGQSKTIVGRIWQRPFAPLPSGSIPPYSRALLSLRAYRYSGAGDITLTVEVWTNNPDGDGVTSTTCLLPGATATGTETQFDLASTCFAQLEPGHNTVYLRFSSNVAAATAVAAVSCVTLFNGVKRTH